MRVALWVALLLSPVAAAAQNGSSTPAALPIPANVTIEGVPPIPMSIVEAVSPYGQFRRARLVAWHPLERRMVIATAFGDPNQLHELRMPAGARTQLTFVRSGFTERPAAGFVPSGRYLIYQRDPTGGGESTQLYRYDVRTGATTMLTDGTSRNGTVTFGVPALFAVSRRSGLVAYDSTRRDPRHRDLYVVDPADPKSDRMIAQLEGQWTAIDWSPDEQSVLAIQTISTSENHLWQVDVATGQKTELTPPDAGAVRWTAAQFAPDGRTIFALSNYQGESARVWRRRDGAWTALTLPDQALEAFALSPDGKTIAIVVDEGSTSRLQLLDASGKPKRTPLLPPGEIADLLWHPSSGDLGFSLAGSSSVNDVYSISLRTNRPERWTWSEAGGVAAGALPEAEIIGWKGFDGLRLSGVMYRPPAAFTGPRPVIINVHGGPVQRERPRFLGRSNYFRNELGITVIYPNIRGSSGFGRTFEELDNGRLRENAVKDIGSLLDWIASRPDLDATRVMIVGPSYGGYIALAASIAYADRLRCAQAALAISDFVAFLESTVMSNQPNRNVEYGDPSNPETRAFLTSISPITNASKLRIPLYLAHGAKDTRIPIEQAHRMARAVKANGTPLWYVVYDELGHQPLPPTLNDFNQYSWTMFVQQYLLH
jgi:dipeptidyl aminopeptidase/acylaminoacyl peptidase